MHGGAIPTVGRVPLMFAVNPRKHFLEATEEVVEGPSDDDIVIGGEEKWYHNGGQTSTCKHIHDAIYVYIFYIITLTYFTCTTTAVQPYWDSFKK